MKKNLSYFAAIAIVLLSCNNTDNKEKPVPEKDQDIAPVQQPPADTHCYSYINKKDTVWLKLTENAGIAAGELSYNFFEKDKNTGTINGEIKGDTIIVDYLFSSEGERSLREVIFLKKGNELVEGYGDMEVKNNRQQFKNTAMVDFSKGIVLKHTDCR